MSARAKFACAGVCVAIVVAVIFLTTKGEPFSYSNIQYPPASNGFMKSSISLSPKYKSAKNAMRVAKFPHTTKENVDINKSFAAAPAGPPLRYNAASRPLDQDLFASGGYIVERDIAEPNTGFIGARPDDV